MSSSENILSQVQNSPINMQKLNEAFMNNMDIIKQILASFQESFNYFEEQFREAEKKGDTEIMSRLAHGLKGSAGNIRAELLSEQAANLQTKIDTGSVFESEFSDLMSSLNALNKQIDALVLP